MPKKTIVSVELLCSKCRRKVMKQVAAIEGITSIVLDPPKNTVTVVGEADPVDIIKKVRKFRRSASIISIGPPKDDTGRDISYCSSTTFPQVPSACQRCDRWYVVSEDSYGYCSIM
ncbi:hypothetical protein SAY87_012575 [Trapa incisa]|uniref:HMA domain-containing protein n=1 Tax=Trapa incisa TaxID=236973 RepID=A0AAN7GK90_9MYRT|nr:hypothetical protein SAY87_012575 [Trapa incisa]